MITLSVKAPQGSPHDCPQNWGYSHIDTKPPVDDGNQDGRHRCIRSDFHL
jgi:hypothetical protein